MFYKNFLYLFLLSFIEKSRGFMGNTVNLKSGKKVSIVGSGSPIFFSTGLFSSMPKFLYNDLVNNLKKNNSIITLDGFDMLMENDLEDICDSIGVNNIAYISHSSFFPEILNSKKINKAVLIDPINIPWFSFNGIERSIINLKYPTLILKAEKLYTGSRTLPEWQNPDFRGDFNEEIILNVGHPDIIDDFWADIAKNIGLWEMAEPEKVDFEEWKIKKSTNTKKIRKDFREYVSKLSTSFINTGY